MDFRTIVDIPKADFEIQPFERMLFAGSCFADNIGKRFVDYRFEAIVNPFGVMYNPASVLHSVAKTTAAPHVAVFTLGTNHVYILKETGEIVDNCSKRPASLFREEELTVDRCADDLEQAVMLLRQRCADVKVIVTVSPIRYAKYGYHGSALSKAVLLLAAAELVKRLPGTVSYFPAYEIVNDELRDYRFYNSDMLHPSDQAVEYIWQRFGETYFSDESRRFIDLWKPVLKAFNHHPFNPDSPEYKAFRKQTQRNADEIIDRERRLLKRKNDIDDVSL